MQTLCGEVRLEPGALITDTSLKNNLHMMQCKTVLSRPEYLTTTAAGKLVV